MCLVPLTNQYYIENHIEIVFAILAQQIVWNIWYYIYIYIPYTIYEISHQQGAPNQFETRVEITILIRYLCELM